MDGEPKSKKDKAAEAAFALAFYDVKAPDLYENASEEPLLSLVRAQAPSESREACLAAIARIRTLCDTVYVVGDRFRSGKFGTGPSASSNAIREIAHQCPGFSEHDYAEAFAAGLRWTAF